MSAILRSQLTSRWRGFVAWAVGLLAVIGLYLPLYPSMQTPSMNEMLASLPPELVETLGYDQITSGPGYAESTFFKLTGFIILTIAAVAWGSAAIAGAEESGELELTLTRAVSRRAYALGSAAALLALLAGLGVVVFAAIAALNGPSELELSLGNLAGATAAWVLLAAVTGAASLCAGAATGRKLWATCAGAAMAIVDYTADALAGMHEPLEWLRLFSPFYWAFGNQPLLNGVDAAGLCALAGLAAVLIAAAAWALSRRDITG